MFGKVSAWRSNELVVEGDPLNRAPIASRPTTNLCAHTMMTTVSNDGSDADNSSWKWPTVTYPAFFPDRGSFAPESRSRELAFVTRRVDECGGTGEMNDLEGV